MQSLMKKLLTWSPHKIGRNLRPTSARFIFLYDLRTSEWYKQDSWLEKGLLGAFMICFTICQRAPRKKTYETGLTADTMHSLLIEA